MLKNSDSDRSLLREFNRNRSFAMTIFFCVLKYILQLFYIHQRNRLLHLFNHLICVINIVIVLNFLNYEINLRVSLFVFKFVFKQRRCAVPLWTSLWTNGNGYVSPLSLLPRIFWQNRGVVESVLNTCAHILTGQSLIVFILFFVVIVAKGIIDCSWCGTYSQ